jgi:two-component sensor histidine kinase
MLHPYPALDEGRIKFSGDDVPIDDRGATPLALIFHELATNAAKYGALSTPAGRIEIVSERRGGDLIVTWTERGSQVRAGPPSRSGFGTRLIDMSVIQQLDGTIDRRWEDDGLVVTVTVQPPRLVRS